MSLINEMLHDLDERRRRHPEARPLPGLENLEPAPIEARSGRGWKRSILPGLLLLAAIGLAMPDEDAAAPPQALDSQPPEVAAAPLAQPLSPAPAVALAEPTSEAVESPGAALARAATTRPGPAAPEPLSREMPRVAARASEPAAAPAPPTSSASKRAALAYRDGLALAADANEAAAREAFEYALSVEPGHPQARAALATLLTRAGDGPAALALLGRGRRAAGDPEAFLGLEARIRAELGDLVGAVALLEPHSADAASGQDAELLSLRATLYQRQGRSEEAAALYLQALARDPGQARWWLGLGIARESQGEVGAALEAYRRAAQAPELDGDTRRWMAGRIRALAALGASR